MVDVEQQAEVDMISPTALAISTARVTLGRILRYLRTADKPRRVFRK